MKTTARVSVLASLLLAPAAIASANETETPMDGEQLEPAVTEEVSATAVPYNVVANAEDESYDTTTQKARLTELFNLNEKVTVANYQNYRVNVETYLGKEEYAKNCAILLAKIDFLEGLQTLAAEARDISNVIAGLKDTNKNLFEDVKNLEARYAAIEKKYIDLRKELDGAIEKTDGYKELDPKLGFVYTDFEALALGGLQTHLINSSEFIDQYIGAAAVTKLTGYIEAIKKPQAFIYGGTIEVAKKPGEQAAPDADKSGDDASSTGTADSDNTSDETPTEIEEGDAPETGNDNSTVTPPNTTLPTVEDPEFTEQEKVPAYVKEIAEMDADYLNNIKNGVLTFLDRLENANKFYNDKMTAQEKKIADSHELDDKRLVSVVMKQANDDLAKANKITDLIREIQSVTGKDYKSKVGKIVSEYEKLNVRAKMLVLDYKLKVANQVIAKKNAGYKDGLDFITLVEALKPNATSEYRTALKEAEDTYDKLADNLQKLLADYQAKLDLYRKDVTAAETVEALIEGLTTGEKVTSEDIKKARKAYDALTASQKKIVDNYKELQAWEKSGKTTIKLSDQIDSIVIENKKTFATKVETLNKTYANLTTGEQSLVNSYPRLKYLIPFATATGKFYNLKTTADNYKTDVLALYTLLTATTGDLVDILADSKTSKEDKAALASLKEKLEADVTALKNQLDHADPVIGLIESAKNEKDAVKQLLAIQTARDAYNALPKEEQKLVTNLKTLTELEKQVKQPAAVTKAIEAVDPTAKTFASKAKSAVTAFDKLTGAQKAFISDENKNRIEDFKTYLAFVDQVKALKSSDPTFQTAYEAAKKQYDKLIKDDAWQSEEKYKLKIIEIIKTYEPTLKALDQAITTGNSLVEAIEGLGRLTGQAFLKEIERIEAAYNMLSPDGKKQVTNYKKFQLMEKDGTSALKVVDLINDPTIKSVDVANRSYAKKVDTALKAYEKLTSNQKTYVYNYTSGLQPYLKIYQVVEAVDNLKPTAKTYIEDVAAVRAMYNRLTNLEKQYLAPLLDKIEGAETGLVTVNEVMTMIDEARPGVEDYIQKLVAAREAYDKLARINSSYQKLVLNYKTLQEREKALKPVATSIHQIKELEGMLARPVNEASEFVRKYNAAVKAYEAIPYESRELVYNREMLLTKIYPVAKTMEAILNIKQTSATFGQDVVKARDWYNSLSAADKALISNYKDLVNFEQTVSGGSAVDELIRQIPRTGPTQYMQAIKEARAAYDQLTAGEKKAVTLYKELQNYEKGVKNVQAAIDAIDNLQFASNLVSAYDKATKALDKLTAEQRQMVHNLNKLQSVGPAIDVYKLIASLKPSSPNYAGSVQAAYTAYNMLSSAEKQFVTNFAVLQEAKNNVDLVQEVISKIAGLTSSSSNYSKQVEEAWALYNSLPSSLRKLVTNYDVLKNAQKEAEAVTKVRALISEINPNAGNFASKVKAARSAYDKLSIQQKRLVSNYFLLEDYEAKLNNSSLFF